MFFVLVVCCMLHIKLCSAYMSGDVLSHKTMFGVSVESCNFRHKTMFGVYVESCILHIKLCSVYQSRAVFCT